MARKRRRSPRGPGLTISQFAEEVDASETVIRAAVKNGLINAIDWNGVKRIPPRERERYLQTWGAQQQRA